MRRRRVELVFLVASAILLACASFDENQGGEPVPEGADAADVFQSGDTSVATDATVDGGTPLCEPEPIEPVETGPEDAGCGPNGLGVSLSTSGEHCGFCGNDCGENQCVGGACQPKTVATADQSFAFGGTTAAHLYFASNAAACGSANVRRLPLTGDGGAEDVFGQGSGCIHSLAIDQDRLFYLRSSSGIHVTPVADAAANDAPVVASNSVIAMHVAPNALFWRDVYGQSVTVGQKDGTASLVVHNEPQSIVHAFAGDGDAAWWIAGPRTDAGVADELLWTRAVGGGSTVARRSGLTSIRALAFDATHVFVASTTGEVFRLRKDDASPPELVTKIDVANHFPRAITVVGNYVFVAVGDPQNPDNETFELYRAKKCGGRARRLGVGYMFGRALFEAGNHLYYGDIASLKRFEITKR